MTRMNDAMRSVASVPDTGWLGECRAGEFGAPGALQPRSLSIVPAALRERRPGRPATAARDSVHQVALEHTLLALEACRRQRDAAHARVEQLTRALELARDLAAQADHAANHDVLTGLANRRLLLDRLELALANARRRATRVAILFLDLVGFKDVNDRLGHSAGDAVLVRVARALTNVIRGGDTASRIGGDEFVILLAELQPDQCIAHVAAEIQSRLQLAARAGAATVRVSASIGIAEFPEHGTSSVELLRYADRAMYASRATQCDAGIAGQLM
jgi:two-component system, sensor histidine kinase LadS